MATGQTRLSCRAAMGMVVTPSLDLQGLGPLEVEEEAFLGRPDVCPRGVPGWVERLHCGGS